jgi:hypothetical protein
MDLGIPNGTLGGSPDGELWYSWACLGQQAITYEAGGAQPRTRTRTNTNPYDTKASAVVRSGCACGAQKVGVC